ncbi:MAG: hypothetical protein Q4B30_01220, partial [Coriobacteriaceae bacterium]|nr:hypothetical protein [Coriobacteriaceae bacterium]
VEDAVAAVRRGLGITKQAEVDKMAADIEAAVQALVERPADYARVDAALATVPKDLSVYTDATRKAVEDAVAAVRRGLGITKQAEVEKMAADIEAAVQALDLRPADYAKVDEALASVPEDLSVYTDATRRAVEDAVSAVKRGYKADRQAEVDKMAADIEAAVRALVKKPAPDRPSKPEPNKPAPDRPSKPEPNKPVPGKPSKPVPHKVEGGLAQTGDPAAVVGMIAAAGSAIAAVGVVRNRRR